MNRLIIITTLILFSTLHLYSQRNNSKACPLLEKASRAYCQENHKAIAKNLQKFIRKYPGHMLREEALFACGNAWLQLEKYEKAKEMFNSLNRLENYNETDSFGDAIFNCNFMQANCRNILVPDFLVNLQHEAYLKLADIGFIENKADEAWPHIFTADKHIRYWYGCGTSDLEEDMRLSMYYSRFYEMKENPDSAIKCILPYTLEPAAFPNNSYEKLTERAVQLLWKKYSKEQALDLFNKSVENIKQNEYGEPDHRKFQYYLYFENVAIHVAPIYLFEHNSNLQDVQKFVKETRFYLLLSQ